MLLIIKELCLWPFSFAAFLVRHWDLLRLLVGRNIASRYRGSYLGFFWLVAQPLLMLGVYSFVFGWIFKGRWVEVGRLGSSAGAFPIVLFSGLIVFNFVAEVLNRSAGLIVAVPNYVKKVVFPLELLSVALLGEALFHALISLLILILGMLVFLHYVPLTILWFPLMLLPLLGLCLGVSWFLAAFGVFVRDVGQTVVVLTTILMFMTPIFYPPTAVPPAFQGVVMFNPLAGLIEQWRRVLVYGLEPQWLVWGGNLLVAFLLCAGGWSCFRRLKDNFADVM